MIYSILLPFFCNKSPSSFYDNSRGDYLEIFKIRYKERIFYFIILLCYNHFMELSVYEIT